MHIGIPYKGAKRVQQCRTRMRLRGDHFLPGQLCGDYRPWCCCLACELTIERSQGRQSAATLFIDPVETLELQKAL